MSTKENDIYLEEMIEKHYNGTPDEKEAVIEKLKMDGFIDEAMELQAEDDEMRLRDKGSEDGMDKFQDKE